jgi:hypothetical protein
VYGTEVTQGPDDNHDKLDLGRLKFNHSTEASDGNLTFGNSSTVCLL